MAQLNKLSNDTKIQDFEPTWCECGISAVSESHATVTQPQHLFAQQQELGVQAVLGRHGVADLLESDGEVKGDLLLRVARDLRAVLLVGHGGTWDETDDVVAAVIGHLCGRG